MGARTVGEARTNDLFARLPQQLRGSLRPAEAGWRAPMLATLTEERFSDPDWLFERKLDGVRCLAVRDGDAVALWSRNQKKLTSYPEVTEALAAQAASRFVVDGEIVAFEGRRTSFARLQGRMQLSDPEAARATGIAVYYYVFDVLQVGDVDLTGLPLTWRKRILRSLLRFDDPVRYTVHRVGAGEEAYRRACRRGDEGVVAKRAAAPYRSRRSPDWLKFKCVRDQEFVVGGWTDPAGSRVALGALLVGYYDRSDFVYAGRVGTGFDEAMLRRLRARMEDLESDRSPFTRNAARERSVHWVRPELVAQIGFSEWTRDGMLRHPRFEGLRDDKDPRDVVRETR